MKMKKIWEVRKKFKIRQMTARVDLTRSFVPQDVSSSKTLNYRYTSVEFDNYSGKELVKKFLLIL
jgi:hypothetical protein